MIYDFATWRSLQTQDLIGRAIWAPVRFKWTSISDPKTGDIADSSSVRNFSSSLSIFSAARRWYSRLSSKYLRRIRPISPSLARNVCIWTSTVSRAEFTLFSISDSSDWNNKKYLRQKFWFTLTHKYRAGIHYYHRVVLHLIDVVLWFCKYWVSLNAGSAQQYGLNPSKRYDKKSTPTRLIMTWHHGAPMGTKKTNLY